MTHFFNRISYPFKGTGCPFKGIGHPFTGMGHLFSLETLYSQTIRCVHVAHHAEHMRYHTSSSVAGVTSVKRRGYTTHNSPYTPCSKLLRKDMLWWYVGDSLKLTQQRWSGARVVTSRLPTDLRSSNEVILVVGTRKCVTWAFSIQQQKIDWLSQIQTQPKPLLAELYIVSEKKRQCRMSTLQELKVARCAFSCGILFFLCCHAHMMSIEFTITMYDLMCEPLLVMVFAVNKVHIALLSVEWGSYVGRR